MMYFTAFLSIDPPDSTLHLIGQQDTSYFHEINTVPIGSYYKSCLTNNTSSLVTGQIEQSETYLN